MQNPTIVTLDDALRHSNALALRQFQRTPLTLDYVHDFLNHPRRGYCEPSGIWDRRKQAPPSRGRVFRGLVKIFYVNGNLEHTFRPDLFCRNGWRKTTRKELCELCEITGVQLKDGLAEFERLGFVKRRHCFVPAKKIRILHLWLDGARLNEMAASLKAWKRMPKSRKAGDKNDLTGEANREVLRPNSPDSPVA